MVEFTIPGTPVGKGRPKFARRGNFVKAYTPEKTASYENLVKLYANQAMAGKPLIEEPVGVVINIVVGVPESWSKKKKVECLLGKIKPTSKPDIDNVIKGIFDAMNEIVWKDDKQVVMLQVNKKYGETPHAWVFITTATDSVSDLSNLL